MSTVVVIQARLGSTRLPGKVLADLNGRPMLAHVVERARAIRGVDHVLVAVPSDDCIAIDDALRDCGALVPPGWPPVPDADVLSRFAFALAGRGAEIIIRLTGDTPLLAPDVAEQALAAFHAQHVDYLGTTRPTLAVPDGMDVEVFTRAALETAHREATDPEDREHVTRYLWRQPARFRLGVMAAVCQTTCWRGDCPCGPCWVLGLKLSVDTEEDLQRARAIHARIPPGDFSLGTTLTAAKEVGL